MRNSIATDDDETPRKPVMKFSISSIDQAIGFTLDVFG